MNHSTATSERVITSTTGQSVVTSITDQRIVADTPGDVFNAGDAARIGRGPKTKVNADPSQISAVVDFIRARAALDGPRQAATGHDKAIVAGTACEGLDAAERGRLDCACIGARNGPRTARCRP